MSLIIKIENLSFSYSGQTVLSNINLDIFEGDFAAIIGPNGGGKSTLLKLMLGLLKSDAGKITIMGEPAGKASSFIGYVPQDVNINNSFPITTLDIVLMGKLNSKKENSNTKNSIKKIIELKIKKDKNDIDEAMAALETMGMADYAKRKISSLSGGQRQRVFIARALISNPKLLLMDEPTSSIDTKGQTDFFNMLQTLNKKMTILVVSHNLLVVSSFVKSVICLNKNLHYHNIVDLTEHPQGKIANMLEKMYTCTVEECCPVEMITNNLKIDTLPLNTDKQRA